MDEFEDDLSPGRRRHRIGLAAAAVIVSLIAIVPAIAIRIAEPSEFRTGCWIHEPPRSITECVRP